MSSAEASNVAALWKQRLQWRVNKSTGENELVGSVINAALILTHDSDYRDCVIRDTFAGVTRIARPLPTVAGLTTPPLGPLTDHHVTHIRMALSSINKLGVGVDTMMQAIEVAAAERAVNPLTDYLSGLRWDAKPRLDAWLTTYLGALPTDDAHAEYLRSVGRWWLLSAIARAYRPGVQSDYMLVLEGGQGGGKTSAIDILGGGWTLHRLPSLRDHDRAAQALAGHWIVEVAELDAFRGAAATQIKDFVSLCMDQYRAPYARLPQTVARACVFIGTTNEEHYLRDATGARRYWPVRTGTIDLGALERDRDQLLAEAVAIYRSGESYADRDRPLGTRWWPPHGDEHAGLRASLAEVQEERQEAEVDAWRPVIAAWVEGVTPVGQRFSAPHDGVTVHEILGGVLELPKKDWDRGVEGRVGIILRSLGLTPRQRRENGTRVRRYYRAVTEAHDATSANPADGTGP